MPDPALPAPEYAEYRRYTKLPDPPPPTVIVDDEPPPAGAKVPPIPMRTDEAIAEAELAELAELAADPRPDVKVERGVALLSGNVPTLLHARVAVDRVSTVRGVRSVVNRLNVAGVVVDDEELGARVRARLGEDPALGDLTLSVSVRDGSVQLGGEVHSYAEKELASQVAESVRGVREVVNELELVPKARSDGEIRGDVLARLAYDAYLSDDALRADVDAGVVSLSGVVGTFMERRRAQTQAWVSGVRAVDVDALVVAPARRDREQRLTRPMPTDEQGLRARLDRAGRAPREAPLTPRGNSPNRCTRPPASFGTLTHVTSARAEPGIRG